MGFFEELIKRVVSNFNAAETDYMITGALAASYYGVPRTTMDIDIIVRVSTQDIRTKILLPLKKAGFQVEEEKIQKVLKSSYKILTLKDPSTPFTLDIIFSSKKLEKRAGTILGLPTFYQKPEDLILAKLRMIKATIPQERAMKDKEDVKAILRYVGDINLEMLKEKARKEKTITILESLMK